MKNEEKLLAAINKSWESAFDIVKGHTPYGICSVCVYIQLHTPFGCQHVSGELIEIPPADLAEKPADRPSPAVPRTFP